MRGRCPRAPGIYRFTPESILFTIGLLKRRIEQRWEATRAPTSVRSQSAPINNGALQLDQPLQRGCPKL